MMVYVFNPPLLGNSYLRHCRLLKYEFWTLIHNLYLFENKCLEIALFGSHIEQCLPCFVNGARSGLK